MKASPTAKRTLLFLLLNFVIVFVVYRIFLYFELVIGMILYLAAAAILAIVYYTVNRGFGKPITDPDDLPKAWSAAEKTAYLADTAKRSEAARKILLWLFPIVLTLLIDITNLFLLEPLFDTLGL